MGDYFGAAAFTSSEAAHLPRRHRIRSARDHRQPNLAERYWPGQDPIGKRLHRGSSEATTLPWLTVVGEISDVKELAADEPTSNQFYTPASQAKADVGPFATPQMLSGNAGSIVVRGQRRRADAGELRAIVRSVDLNSH